MCLIINNPTGKPIKHAYIKTAYENNKDGFGIMWADQGRVFTNQGLFTLDVIKELLKELNGVPYACHFRYRTRGKIEAEMTHPFRVLSKEDDGEDLWLMHNGTFSHIKITGNESDSAIFANDLHPIFRETGTDKLFDEYVPRLLGERLGQNKVLFMRGDGKVSIINDNLGFYEDCVWYSNDYSLKANYRENLKLKAEAEAALNQYTNWSKYYPVVKTPKNKQSTSVDVDFDFGVRHYGRWSGK